jgi:hypothetical protein
MAALLLFSTDMMYLSHAVPGEITPDTVNKVLMKFQPEWTGSASIADYRRRFKPYIPLRGEQE